MSKCGKILKLLAIVMVIVTVIALTNSVFGSAWSVVKSFFDLLERAMNWGFDGYTDNFAELFKTFLSITVNYLTSLVTALASGAFLYVVGDIACNVKELAAKKKEEQ